MNDFSFISLSMSVCQNFLLFLALDLRVTLVNLHTSSSHFKALCTTLAYFLSQLHANTHNIIIDHRVLLLFLLLSLLFSPLLSLTTHLDGDGTSC